MPTVLEDVAFGPLNHGLDPEGGGAGYGGVATGGYVGGGG
jgi:hypothetical protein